MNSALTVMSSQGFLLCMGLDTGQQMQLLGGASRRRSVG